MLEHLLENAFRSHNDVLCAFYLVERPPGRAGSKGSFWAAFDVEVFKM